MIKPRWFVRRGGWVGKSSSHARLDGNGLVMMHKNGNTLPMKLSEGVTVDTLVASGQWIELPFPPGLHSSSEPQWYVPVRWHPIEFVVFNPKIHMAYTRVREGNALEPLSVPFGSTFTSVPEVLAMYFPAAEGWLQAKAPPWVSP